MKTIKQTTLYRHKSGKQFFKVRNKMGGSLKIIFIQDRKSVTFKNFFALMEKGFMISKLFERIATVERRDKAFVVQ